MHWANVQLHRPDLAVSSGVARSVREDVLGERRIDDPIEVSAVARLFACVLRRTSSEDLACCGVSGLLRPLRESPSRFEILYPTGQARTRQRFTVAHELGHTFFFDRAVSPPSRLSPHGGRAEERFCDLFASELLVPRSAIRRPLDARRCLEAAAHFFVSPQVVALRAVRARLFPYRAMMGVALLGKPSAPEALAPRISWVVSERGTWVPLAARLKQFSGLEEIMELSDQTVVRTVNLGSCRGAYEHAIAVCGRQIVLALRPAGSPLRTAMRGPAAAGVRCNPVT